MRITERGHKAELRRALDVAARVVGRESLGNVYMQGTLPNITLAARESAGKLGRRGRRASWEAHRIFLDVLFSLRPGARVETGLTTYRGAADFVARHKATERSQGWRA